MINPLPRHQEMATKILNSGRIRKVTITEIENEEVNCNFLNKIFLKFFKGMELA